MLTGGLTDVREGVSREVWYESEAVRPRVPPGLLAGAVSRLLLFLVVEHLQLAVEIHVKELGGFWLHQICLHWFTFHLESVQSWIVVSGGESYLALVRSEIKMIRICLRSDLGILALPVLCGGRGKRSLTVLTVTITVLSLAP